MNQFRYFVLSVVTMVGIVVGSICVIAATEAKKATPASIVCAYDNQVAKWTGRYREDHTSHPIVNDKGQIVQDIDIMTTSCEYQHTHKHWNQIDNTVDTTEVHTIWSVCEVK